MSITVSATKSTGGIIVEDEECMIITIYSLREKEVNYDDSLPNIRFRRLPTNIIPLWAEFQAMSGLHHRWYQTVEELEALVLIHHKYNA